MARQQKIMITVGLLFLLLLGGGFFVNYLLNNMVTALNAPQVDHSLLEPREDEVGGDELSRNELSGDEGKSVGGLGIEVIGNGEAQSHPNISEGKGISSSNTAFSNQDIAKDVQKKIDKPIEKGDLITAGKIIIRKLSIEEISFLYKVGRKDSYTRDELIETREILTTKLTDEEITTLRTLGGHYGKALRILDTNVEIK